MDNINSNDFDFDIYLINFIQKYNDINPNIVATAN